MLLYFILGLCFVLVFHPIVDFIQAYLEIITEYITYFYAYKSAIFRKKILDLKLNQEQEQEKNPIGFCTQAIGFQTLNQEEQEE